MRCALLRILPLALLLAALPARARVVVVGVDGGSWNVVDALAAAGDLPNLSALAARGATARLSTVEPVTSPVVWTSIATGRSPSAHGVGDFFATRLSIRVPTVYERLARDAARVGLYDVLMTWPPVDLPGGFVIPGWLRRDDAVTPPDVWARAGVEPFVNEYDRARTTADYLERARLEGERKAGRFEALVRAFDPQVAAVTFYAVDMTSHRFWHAAWPDAFDGEGRDAPEAERLAIRDAYRGVDRAIGRIAGALGPDDTILVVSDHGFRAREDGLRNVWVAHADDLLAAADLSPGRDGFALVGAFGAVTLRVHPGDVAARDAVLERLMAWLRSFRTADGRSLFRAVEFVDVAPRPPGAERPWWSRARQWVVRQVIERVFGVRVDDGAHAVAFALPDDAVLDALWPDGEVRVLGRTMPVSRAFSRQRFSGEHDPTGIFLAAGGPVAARAERGDVSVLDVAPLVLYLAGRPVPDDLEGRLPTGILRPEALEARAPRGVPADALPGLAPPAPGAPETPGDALVEKLRALGYVE